jgi:hypothetical protein
MWTREHGSRDYPGRTAPDFYGLNEVAMSSARRSLQFEGGGGVL